MVFYSTLSTDNRITREFSKNLFAEIKRSDFIARIERRNQIVKRLREELFNPYEEEFFSEKLVLGTIKGNKELVRIYQKQAVWENIDKDAGPKRHEGNIVCFQDSDGKTKYGIVCSYGKEKIHLRTANGDKTIHYTQEVYFYTNFHKFSLEIGVSSKSTASKITIINRVYNLLSDEQKKDDMIPEDMSFVKGFDSEGNIDYFWPEYFGFEKSTIRPITLGLTKDLTRVGSSRGSNLSTRIYSYGALAIPYKGNEKSLRMYNFQSRFYKEKIDAIEKHDLQKLNRLLSMQGVKKIKAKDIKPVFKKYDKFQEKLEEYNINSIFKYGIYGKAAPMYGNGKILPGGATQILFPLSIAYMQLLGMLYLA